MTMVDHPQTADAARREADSRPTLYVDMDGALCATDTLWESILVLGRRHPWNAWKLPLWVASGKAGFKHRVADHVLPDVDCLPLRPEVLRIIQDHKDAGGKVVLATAADIRIGRAVAEQIGLFDDVLGSESGTNLAASNKLDAIRRHAGGEPFDYLGDSSADVCIFAQCRHGYVVGGRRGVWSKACRFNDDAAGRVIAEVRPASSGLKPVLKALRPHQWAKNVLIAVPLVVSHTVNVPQNVLATVLAIVSFSLVASAVYIVNDLLDLPCDRKHPTKRNRPFASGAVAIPVGIAMFVALLIGGLGLAALGVGMNFAAMVLLYMLATTLYSTVLKRKLILDVFTLAGLYTLRILAGAVAIQVEPTPWLLAFSMFLFISLAFAKRYAELKMWRERDASEAPGRRYHVQDMELFKSVGPTAAYLAVLVLALYINSADVTKLYQRPWLLWLVCPVLLYWITRTWFLVDRSELMEDPVVFALKDKASWVCGTVILLLIFFATIAPFRGVQSHDEQNRAGVGPAGPSPRSDR